MKNKRMTRIFQLVMIMLIANASVFAADYYVVIGTFAEEANARRFTAKVSPHFRSADYTFNAARNVWYVHVLKTDRKEEADRNRAYLREKRGYRDAWVYTAAPETSLADSPTVEEVPGRPLNQGISPSLPGQTGPALASADERATFLSYSEDRAADEVTEVKERSAAGIAELRWKSEWDVSYIPGIENPERFLAENTIDADRVFTFIVENSKGEQIDAEVMLVNFEKAKRITSFRAGEHAAIRGTRREQMVTLVCDVLGYAQETRMYNIDHLSRGRDIRKNKDGVWEVRFRLKDMEANEIAYLSKTSFYANSAVLQPSSKEEVETLVAWMRANPGKKIIIHSHANPGGKREFRLPVKNYFDLEGTVVKTGSDKKLSRARAQALKQYLLDHGIDSKRVSTVAWGSLEPWAKHSGPDAELNDRVEFEIVE